jgi:hypothetical protein
MSNETKLEKYLIDGKVQEINPKDYTFTRMTKCISEKDCKVECWTVEESKDGIKIPLHFFVTFDLSKSELLEYAVRQFHIREWRSDPLQGTNKVSLETLKGYKDKTFKVSEFQNKTKKKSADPKTDLLKTKKKLEEQGYTTEQIVALLTSESE